MLPGRLIEQLERIKGDDTYLAWCPVLGEGGQLFKLLRRKFPSSSWVNTRGDIGLTDAFKVFLIALIFYFN